MNFVVTLGKTTGRYFLFSSKVQRHNVVLLLGRDGGRGPEQCSLETSIQGIAELRDLCDRILVSATAALDEEQPK